MRLEDWFFFWFLSWIPVSSSCIHGIKCGDGNRKWESQWCDGVTDCPTGQDEANCGKQLHGGKKKLLYPPPLDLFNKAEWNTLIRTWFPKKKNLENNKWNVDFLGGKFSAFPFSRWQDFILEPLLLHFLFHSAQNICKGGQVWTASGSIFHLDYWHLALSCRNEQN